MCFEYMHLSMCGDLIDFFLLKTPRPPRSTRPDSPFPYTTLVRSGIDLDEGPSPEVIDLEPGQVEERSYRGGVYGILDSELTDWLSSEIGIRREMQIGRAHV